MLISHGQTPKVVKKICAFSVQLSRKPYSIKNDAGLKFICPPPGQSLEDRPCLGSGRQAPNAASGPL
jgi:hypothetical protein